MADILIRGVTMPEMCVRCIVCDQGYCRIRRTHVAEEEFYEKKPDCCSLIELPPHGDLIDRDALKQDIVKHLGIRSEQFLTAAESAIVSRIYNAPTVIPADKDGEE